jgi:hyperosmotically inducible protein
MRSSSIAVCLAVAALFTPILAAADTDAARAEPGSYVKDSVITTKVKAKLADEKMSSLLHIDVDTDNKGAVALSGTVKTRYDAERAVAIARATEGVVSVHSTIRVVAAE